MTTSRLLLVHGAFHGAWCWDHLATELNELGIPFETVDLPFTSAADDVAAVREAIDRSDERVTVLGHSFGGSVISSAAAEDGRPYGPASSLIFLTAFMARPEQTIDFSGAPGIDQIEFGETTASIDPVVARSVFYHRCAVEDAEWASAQLRTMPITTFAAPPPPVPAWDVLPSTYIVCTDDQILSASGQEQMAENANRVFRIDSDHSPFLSYPATLAELLGRIVADE